MERRAARLGLTLKDVALRMGVDPSAVTDAFTKERLSEGWFMRLCNALEMRPRDWNTPLPARPEPLQIVRTIRERQRALHQEETKKRSAREKPGGGSGQTC